jgi:hypothetical protein
MAEKIYVPFDTISKIYSGGAITQPRFYPSYYEFLREQGRQYNGSVQLTSPAGGIISALILTVAKIEQFYLTSVSISLSYNAVSPVGIISAYIEVQKQNTHPIRIDLDDSSGLNTAGICSSKTFSIPWKIEQTDNLSLVVVGKGTASATIEGFFIEAAKVPILT